ncbi:hypothetical protein JY97_00535 [Alkalispirochaeta odontotermitis]|nr:hypothetical protein JY97_00535 [Alkalispirochaeta odontotermitis]
MEKIDLQNLIASSGQTFAQVADKMGVARSQLTRWSQRKVPAERVQELSVITGIPAKQLRPDIFETPKERA